MQIFTFVSQYVQIQRQLKTSESDKADAQDRVNELTTQKNSLQSAKYKAEQTLTILQEEYEEMETESRNNTEKLRKATEQVCVCVPGLVCVCVCVCVCVYINIYLCVYMVHLHHLL